MASVLRVERRPVALLALQGVARAQAFHAARRSTVVSRSHSHQSNVASTSPLLLVRRFVAGCDSSSPLRRTNRRVSPSSPLPLFRRFVASSLGAVFIPASGSVPSSHLGTTMERATEAPPVVVIGAGASGLASVKSCLEEGLKVVCFEKTEQIGGLWRFRPEVVEGLASVMRSTIINSCKELSAFSDFPPPADFPNFMHNKLQVEYFDLYADRFDLRRHIRFGHQILRIRQAEDFDASGRWTVTVKNLESGCESEVLASAVMVCSGHHHSPHIPDFAGLSEFGGEVRHTHTYKDYRGYEDKAVLVVGIGNSGGDVAVELSRIAAKVYLSTRSGSWVLTRVGPGGLPTDYMFLRRCTMGPSSFIPRKLHDFAAEYLFNARFDHALYNLKPKHGIFQQHPMVNDALPNCILSGTVAVKGDVRRFTPSGVVFQDGVEESEEVPLDAVILATGYTITFPFADQRLLTAVDNRVRLYKYVFPPDLRPSTLAVIGLIQPLGSIVPISELQARWSVRVFSGQLRLPSAEAMHRDVRRLGDAMNRKYHASRRHTVQVDYMDYMDDVGQLLDVLPDLRRLFFKDPGLWVRCYFGANVPFQYRLRGPHAWKGARDAIFTSYERVKAPLQTRTSGGQRVMAEGAKGARSFWAYVAVGVGLLTFVLGFVLV